MSSRWRIWRGALCGTAAIAAVALVDAPTNAQSPAREAGATLDTSAPRVPRTPWGAPDLQGTWDFTTITPFERPAQFAGREFLTDEEAAEIEREINRRRFESEEKDPGAFAPANGDPNDPGIYNLGWWWEPEGRKLVQTRRTSLVIDPSDGRLPALTPQARATFNHREEIRARRFEPADLPLAERCILGFNSGPPMVPGPYNNLVQLFQSPGYVVIVNEMVHDARVVPLDGRAQLGSSMQFWTGDSRGRWEGDTLVVETRNFTDQGTGTFGLPGLSDRNMHLVERFTRVDDRTLVYQFTVNDPPSGRAPGPPKSPCGESTASSSSTRVTRAITAWPTSSPARARRSAPEPVDVCNAVRARRRSAMEGRMFKKGCIAGLTVWLWLGAAGAAHHSVAVNFDNSKALTLTGRITDLDIRNPHSQITLEVAQPDGTVKEWLIEWSDRNALVRRKVPFQLLRVGDTVTINASPSRRLDSVAYFRTAVLPDKSILRDCGFVAFRATIAKGETVECEPERAR